jgi:type IV pilus assembly protein PilA
MRLQLRSNNKAFSMIELMVVVAIIGVLAAIGIPEYSKFQAKARQSEAKLSLAALFTAEESFRQQWNSFSIDLFNIGFSVQGTRLRYVTGFQGTDMGGAACTGYPSGGGAPAESTTATTTWSDGSAVNTYSATWALGVQTKPTIASLTNCTNAVFTATAYGTPATSGIDPGPTAGDTWTINESKLLTNYQVYLGL